MFTKCLLLTLHPSSIQNLIFRYFLQKISFGWKPEYKEKLIFDHPNWQQKINFLAFFKKSVALENPNVGEN